MSLSVTSSPLRVNNFTYPRKKVKDTFKSTTEAENDEVIDGERVLYILLIPKVPVSIPGISRYRLSKPMTEALDIHCHNTTYADNTNPDGPMVSSVSTKM